MPENSPVLIHLTFACLDKPLSCPLVRSLVIFDALKLAICHSTRSLPGPLTGSKREGECQRLQL